MRLGSLLLRSPAPPEEVLRRVQRLVMPLGAASIGDAGSAGRRRAFRGGLHGRRFVMRRVLSSGRASPVRVSGEVAPSGAGSEIRIRLALAGARAYAVLVALAASAVLAGIVVARAAGAGEIAGERLTVLLAFPFAAAAALLPIVWERARVRRLLGYLTGQITYSGLAHELAEARE
jgi:hypothetical protein